MIKTMPILLAFLIGLIPSSLRAQTPPEVSIGLSLSKDFYRPGEAAGATITINNKTGGPIYINNDFISRDYYLELRITDPAGRVIPAKRPPDLQGHEMKPLAFRYDKEKGRVFEEGLCSLLASGPVNIRAPVDLRQYYDLSLPGRYLAQVQMSAMQFLDSACNVGTYLWQGMLESNVATFYMAGDTQVSLTPSVWPVAWKNEKSVPGVVTATLTIPEVDVNQLETRAIYLNNVYSGDAVVKGNSVAVTFDGRQAIDSLGTVERGKTYKVRVAGWYKGGGYFGGLAEIVVGEHYQGLSRPR